MSGFVGIIPTIPPIVIHYDGIAVINMVKTSYYNGKSRPIRKKT